jgi:hypothetical protein
MIKPTFHHVNLKTTRLQEMIDWYGVPLRNHQTYMGLRSDDFTTPRLRSFFRFDRDAFILNRKRSLPYLGGRSTFFGSFCSLLGANGGVGVGFGIVSCLSLFISESLSQRAPDRPNSSPSAQNRKIGSDCSFHASELLENCSFSDCAGTQITLPRKQSLVAVSFPWPVAEPAWPLKFCPAWQGRRAPKREAACLVE